MSDWHTSVETEQAHWDDCWRDHHTCAIVALLAARREAEQVRDRLHWATERPGADGTTVHLPWEDPT